MQINHLVRHKSTSRLVNATTPPAVSASQRLVPTTKKDPTLITEMETTPAQAAWVAGSSCCAAGKGEGEVLDFLKPIFSDYVHGPKVKLGFAWDMFQLEEFLLGLFLELPFAQGYVSADGSFGTLDCGGRCTALFSWFKRVFHEPGVDDVSHRSMILHRRFTDRFLGFQLSSRAYLAAVRQLTFSRRLISLILSHSLSIPFHRNV